MSACPSCGFANPENRDFCPKCGSYTRWDPTVHVAAVRPATPDQEQAQTPGQPPPPPPAEDPPPIVTGVAAPVAEGVIVTVRKPGDESADAPVAITLQPGSQAPLSINVRNQSGIVDNYDLEVRGMPKEWWTISPPTVYLVPYGAAGGSYEQEAALRLHPPRSPEAEAREWPIEIVAVSRAHGQDAGSATAGVTLEPYTEIESELRPQIAGGRRGATFAIAVRNVANAPVAVAVSALDGEGECRFDFDKPQLKAPPGRRDGTPFRVKPPSQMIVGRTKERRFTVSAQAVGSDVAARPQQATYRQKPWIPPWVLPIVPIVIAAGVAIWALKPNTTKVPVLTGSTVFAAQQKLSDAGLKLGQKTPLVTAKFKSGTIINSVPAAGKSVDKGKEVNVLIAVGSGKVKVPVVVGLTFTAADVRLHEHHLQIGQYNPKPNDPSVAMITSQTPLAGQMVPTGTAVDLAIDPNTIGGATTATTDTTGSTSSTGGASTGGASTGGADGQTTGGSGAALVMPAFAGVAFGAAVNKLGGAVKTQQQQVYSDTVPEGQIVSTDPAKGAPLTAGQTVTLFISKGPVPPIAFSRNGKIYVEDDAGKLQGQPVTAASGSVAVEPAWSPKGDQIAFVQHNADDTSANIWVVNPAQPQTAHPLTNTGYIDHRPSYSPDGKVIAFVRALTTTPDHLRLCFKRVHSSGHVPLCMPSDPNLSVARPAWSPDGHAISVIITAGAKDAGQTEIGLYTSGAANSYKPSSWVWKGAITESMHGHAAGEGTWYAAWSPDGKTLAASVNWGTPFAHLELIPMNNDQVGGKPVAVPRVHACQLSWRADGVELVVRQAENCDAQDPAAIQRVVLATRASKPLQSGLDPAWAPNVAKP